MQTELDERKTLAGLTQHYNNLCQAITELGGTARQRTSFKSKAEAEACIARQESALKAHKEGATAMEKQASKPGKGKGDIRSREPAEEQAAPTTATEEADVATTKTKTKKTAAPATKRAQPFDNGLKVKILTPDPFRKGSNAAKRFSKYKDGMTVEQLLKAGATRTDLRSNVDRKYIKLA